MSEVGSLFGLRAQETRSRTPGIPARNRTILLDFCIENRHHVPVMRTTTHTDSNRTERTMTITADYPNLAEAEEAIETIANHEMVLLRVSIEIEMPDHVDLGYDRYTPTGKDSSYRISQPGNKTTPMPAAEYGYENKRLWLGADGHLLED